MDIEISGKESLRRADIQVWHSKEWSTLYARGTMRTSKRRRMWVFVCSSELVLDESLSHQHMGAVYNRGSSSTAGELDYFSAYIRLREPDKSEDKANHRSLALIEGEYRKGAEEVENAEELQVLGLDRRAEAKGLRVDVGVLTKE
ncbi:hypothetical protein BHE74_00014079 [Ensete ventricosum]|nr:hypothetical protein GW17_00033777 [Ensete ventricosum]RWW77741.1 hypothetical protein BHE74_00014079 [Ensete ventricosum]